MPPRSRLLRRAITIAIILVAIVVIVLVALVADNILVLPGSSPSPVTVSYVHLIIEEGNVSSPSGGTWFGGPWFLNYSTSEGFPLQVKPGGSFSIVWENLINFDSVNHTIYGVTAYSPGGSHPFTIASTLPALPHKYQWGSEGGNLAIYVTVPSTPGTTYPVTLVVDALTPG